MLGQVTSVHEFNSIIKFADDTTVTDLISDNDETAYRVEVQHLVAWCADNNLLLNTSKTKELFVDFRREKGTMHGPIHINRMAVKRLSSFQFLETHISEDPSSILVNFYRCAIESILTNCITVWYGNCSAADRKALQLENTGSKPAEQRGMSSPDPLHELVETLHCALASMPGSTAPASSSASAAASPLSPVITSPVATLAPYSGSAEDCNGFLLQCSKALEMQPHSYPDDRAKVAFIISHLGGKALRWAKPLWTQNNPIIPSLPRFIEHFKEVFGQPERDSSLGERLCHLKQGSMSVSDYALQFRTLAAASG
ncbi:hypothetical protein QTP86_017748 [Hemibagrus guttatus]|nr:hypothetical protein QTP86_017748 [Hemibagrus guttatus]